MPSKNFKNRAVTRHVLLSLMTGVQGPRPTYVVEWWEERTNSLKIFSDLYMYAVLHTHAHAHTNLQTLRNPATAVHWTPLASPCSTSATFVRSTLLTLCECVELKLAIFSSELSEGLRLSGTMACRF